MADGSAFFAPLPEPPAPEPQWDPLGQPDWLRVPHEIAPVSVGGIKVIAASEDFALVLGPLIVFDRGLLLDLTVVRNPSGGARTQKLMSEQHGPHGRQPGGWRAGLRWDDGRTARTDASEDHSTDAAPGASMITRGGGGSSEATGSLWWVWPLPQAGDLDLVVEFSAGGIPETCHRLPGDAIRAASAAAAPIWPGARPKPA